MKIGVSTGKNNNVTKPLACDSSSTYQFGEVQPILCMEMEAESSVKSFLRSQVRLGVLNVPTFGRMLYNVDARFVPMVDVYRPFEELITQQTYSTGDRTYVPTSVPVISVASLSAFVLSLADCTCYQQNSDHPDEFVLLRGTGSDVRDVPLARFNYIRFVSTFYHDFRESDGRHNYLGSRDLFSQYALNEYVPRPGQGTGADSPSLKWIQVSPSSADFMYRLTISDGEGQNPDIVLLYCFRLNNDARRLYKILVGCGWQFDLSNQDKISFLPFLAFFKGYFDLYRPKTTADGPFTFDQTPAHRLMEQIVHYNIVDLDVDGDVPISGYVTAFLTDLMVSTYFEDTDYVTSHISKPALSNSSLKPVVSDPNSLGNSEGQSGSAGATAGTQPSLNGNSSSTTQTRFTDTAWNVRLLLRLLPYINKNTVIGGNIEKYLKAHGYGDVLENRDTFSAGATYQLPCRISDIDSVADTFNESTGEGDLLGAYTGKGLGQTPSDSPANFEYYTRVPGFFVMYASVIPLSRVSQGINPMLFHREKLEFYDSAFDALDFSVSRKSLVNGRSEVETGISVVGADPQVVSSPAQAPFGFIPRYSEYCYLPNVLNGGLSLRSNRSTFISYVLDKYYQSYSEYIKPLNDTDFLVDLSVGYNVPVATPQLRNIANPLNGNFSRIFAQAQIVGGYDTRSSNLDWYNYEDDKFVVHNAIDVLYSSGKKKLSESFETEDNGSQMIVSKE